MRAYWPTIVIKGGLAGCVNQLDAFFVLLYSLLVTF